MEEMSLIGNSRKQDDINNSIFRKNTIFRIVSKHSKNHCIHGSFGVVIHLQANNSLRQSNGLSRRLRMYFSPCRKVKLVLSQSILDITYNHQIVLKKDCYLDHFSKTQYQYDIVTREGIQQYPL